MKLSRLYSNKPHLFAPVDFVSGLNVVSAEIRLPENRNKDTHNLGKTTLGRVLDFGFLASREPKFFLFKHHDLFREFVFFLEIELMDATYVTVRRSVEEPSRISFKKHKSSRQDFTALPVREWDHFDMPFERSLEMLDIRRYATLGIQPIITLIDSDLPARNEDEGPVFDESEIVLRLHDENEQGRLFKMPSW
jgi:uncharacterized protein YydD (DUF2326 family)